MELNMELSELKQKAQALKETDYRLNIRNVQQDEFLRLLEKQINRNNFEVFYAPKLSFWDAEVLLRDHPNVLILSTMKMYGTAYRTLSYSYLNLNGFVKHFRCPNIPTATAKQIINQFRPNP